MSAEPIIGGVIGALVTVAGFFGVTKWQERQRRQTESRRNHFKDLESGAIEPLRKCLEKLYNSYGGFLEHSIGVESRPTWVTRDFEYGEFRIFKLHFLSQAKTITEFMNNVDKHNEKLDSFTSNIGGIIEAKANLPVRDGGKRPFIYTGVPKYLRITLYQLAKKKSLQLERIFLSHDFQQAKVQQKNGFWSLGTDGTTYAETTTEAQAKSCKTRLIELTECTSLIEEACQIYTRAKQLETESRGIVSFLNTICRDYGRYGKLLEKQKDCPACQVIFHPKKRSKNV